MTTEHLAILVVLTPAFLFLIWVINRLEQEIARLRNRSHLHRQQPTEQCFQPTETQFKRSA